ncbi:sensor histidine kinase [Paenibacillus sp. LHD-117]|uniref:sensor histidine kinase n=1 Tax=Paenibacillus sp. LHD-117 TaxID=3071412 RepID=UPI0027E204CD|nr:sensor histidine kinase [Paenibacillus sp. LHD-117]MDQ6419164.1 sensor histidine kinase [Paenibacillus sp. LHD-117]
MLRKMLSGRKLGLNHIRLRDKMMIVYLLCVLLPILLTNIIFYQVTSDNVKRKNMEDTTRALEQVKNQLWTELEGAINVSNGFFTDNKLYELLETEYTRPADYIEAYDSYFRRILNSYTPVYASVQNIKIYLDNPTLLHSGGIGFLSSDVKQSEWYKTLGGPSSNATVFVRSPREDLLVSNAAGGASETFSIVRRMNYFDSMNKWEKVLKIELKMSTLHAIVSNLNVKGAIYLVNDRGEVEYSNRSDFEWLGARQPFDDIKHPSNSIQFRTSYPADSMLDKWQMIAVVSEKEIFTELYQSRKFVYWIAAINLIVPTLIITWIARSITARLGNILKYMKRVKNQHFDTIHQEETRDEIGQLTGEFNRMTLQIRSLINDVYVADIRQKSLELERRKAQLNALQSQINPHFLFNALETIRMRSVIKKETETAKIIHNMAKLFRSSLTWKRDMVTVREEMEFILCFLEIQQYRFGDRLTYDLAVDPEAESCLIPKFVYLPFVENACIHGVEQVKKGGHIDLRIEVHPQMIYFSIRDNGGGMGQEQLENIRLYLAEDAELGERIGVQNVIYRLKLLYGEGFIFAIDSEPGQGTIVKIGIPIEGSALIS